MRPLLRATVLIAACLLLLTATCSQVRAAPPPDTYTVQVGDTLYAISLRFHTTVATLKKLNNLSNDLIVVGQKLSLPSGESAAPAPAAASSYLVQPGDTLYRIALRYGTTVQDLEELNGLANPHLISPGQALAVPASSTLVKPGLTIEPLTTRQGGTVLIQVARPDLTSVTGVIYGRSIPFTRAAGYFYALAGISRCAKTGPTAITLTETDTAGQATTESATISVAATAFLVQTITLPPSKGDLLEPTLVNREAADLAVIVGRRTPVRLWSGAFRQPVSGPITSPYGTRRSYNGGPIAPCGHEGTDFDENAGVPVSADARGRVVFAGLTQVRGNMVVVDHGIGVFTGYYHLSEIDVQIGQMVEASELIGKVGTTGLSTGAHLHWSLWINGEYVDPIEWTRRRIP